MKKGLPLVCILLLMFFQNSFAQTSIKGLVTDSSNAPLAGAAISLKGTNTGATANNAGEFTIVAPGNGILIISSVGYKSMEVAIGQRTQLLVSLFQDSKALDDIVVVGYGTLRKKDVTGSIGSVSSKDLTAYPVPNPLLGLQGKTPGVQVIQNSSAPGANISVRIRGGNSLLGSNEPLYVVDGIALSGGPNAINPNDIESIDVLKDASATAIYGSRGANGVVLITTKRGKDGKTRVDFDTYRGTQQVIKKIPLMNASEFAQLANQRAVNDGGAPYFTQAQIASFAEGTDWQDELFRSAALQNYSVTASGGTEKTQYSFSGSFLGQDGIIIGSNIKRETLRGNITQKLSNQFNLSFNTVLSNSDYAQINSDNGEKGNSVLSGILVAPPTVTPRNNLGAYSDVAPYSFSPNLLFNPLVMALEAKNKTNTRYILAGTALTFNPVKSLSFKTSFGVETATSRQDQYSPSLIFTTPNGQANVSSDSWINILNENTVTFNKQINNDHNITVLGGVTYQQRKARSFGTGNVTGFITDNLATNDLASGSVPGTSQSAESKWVLFSYLSRINYSYKGTYLLTGSIRADGSSRFGEGNKWGYFPSAAFAWRIINERFARNIRNLSDLKFRVSWGLTGSTAVTPYQTLNSLRPYQSVFNDQIYIGIGPNATQLANPDLKWETTKQTNVGLDAGFFKNRVTFSFDYYVKDTKDLLANIPIPGSSGYMGSIGNLGRIRNSGIELGINTIIFDGAFKWNLNANFTKNRNKVIELANGNDIFGARITLPLSTSVNLVRVGQPVGVFYGYLEDGLDEKGQIKYKDLDGKAGLTVDDRTILGDPNPLFLYNFGSGMSYKNFELNVQFQGSQGADIFNVNLTSQANGFYLGENQLRDVFYESWTPANPNPNAKYPKVSAATKFLPSDRYIEDGSFLRLRNVQLAYNVPVSTIKAKWLQDLQLYISGQNLLTFTKYSWYDPEVNTRGGDNSISLGIDNTGYPNTKMYTFGLRLGL